MACLPIRHRSPVISIRCECRAGRGDRGPARRPDPPRLARQHHAQYRLSCQPRNLVVIRQFRRLRPIRRVEHVCEEEEKRGLPKYYLETLTFTVPTIVFVLLSIGVVVAISGGVEFDTAGRDGSAREARTVADPDRARRLCADGAVPLWPQPHRGALALDDGAVRSLPVPGSPSRSCSRSTSRISAATTRHTARSAGSWAS